ncbi:MAG: pilin [Pseudomonadota bacterium]|nr:pilin [Pseudomonadota bacterium]
MKNSVISLLLLLTTALGWGAAAADSLRGRVPSDVLAYLRIPDVPGFLTAPKDSVLKGPLSHPDHIAQVEALRSALYEKVLGNGEGSVGPLAALLLGRLTAPLEAVAIPASPEAPGLPVVLIRTQLDFETLAAFRSALNDLAEQDPRIQVLAPPADDGFGIIVVGSVPLLFQYDADSGEIYLMASAGIDRQRFNRLMRLPPVIETTPMREMENRIDTSGRGLFMWWNVAGLMPLARGALDPAQLADLEKWGFTDVRSASMGWGVEGGKGRMSVLIDSPETGYRGLLPEVSTDLSLSAAGKPGLVVAMPILDQRFVDALLEIATREGRSGARRRYAELGEQFLRETGVSLDELFSALGPDAVFFTDLAGGFLGVRVADPRGYRDLVSKLARRPGVVHETRTIRGLRYHHLAVPEARGGAAGDDPGSAAGDVPGDRLRTHWFWVEEGGYLVFAQTPQALMDRQGLPRVPLDEWLRTQQRVDGSNALFLFSTEVPNLPRIVYYTYLDLLMLAGDLAGYPIRIFDLPSASQLSLPDTGAYSVVLSLADPLLSLEFVFENNPAEILVASGPGMIGVIGVLAAIAIPAYQDYTVRANVAAGLTVGAGKLKTAVSEFYAANGRLPKGMVELGLDPAGIGGDGYLALVDELAIVRISLTGGPLDGGSVFYVPNVHEGKLEWLCRSRDLDGKHVPAECR